MPDNPDPSQTGNPDPNSTTTTTIQPAPPAAQPDSFTWKSHLSPDFANSPTMKLFPDTKEGFNNAVKSHLELQKVMGNEKVPIPKSKDDTVALSLFRKAMGVPEKPDGYALPDVEVPDSLKGLTFDKAKFAETIHKHDLTPAAARGLWDAYTGMAKQSYADAVKQSQERVTAAINQNRAEWGDAYQSKIELGQMVLNKFSENQEINDFVTSVLAADPRGHKFLAKIGDQFAENKIGDFKYQRHALTPEEAQRELDSIKTDMNHPYNNPKAPEAEHNRAVEYVNSLISVVKRPKG